MSYWLIRDEAEIDIECKEPAPWLGLTAAPVKTLCDLDFGHDGVHSWANTHPHTGGVIWTGPTTPIGMKSGDLWHDTSTTSSAKYLTSSSTTAIPSTSIKAHSVTGSDPPAEGELIVDDDGRPLGYWVGGKIVMVGGPGLYGASSASHTSTYTAETLFNSWGNISSENLASELKWV